MLQSGERPREGASTPQSAKQPREETSTPQSARQPRGEASAPRRGDRLPGTPFLVLGSLGEGGMGEVFEVEHAELGRRFAVKMLHRRHLGRRDLAVRMRQEARSLALLRHPNLVDVFDLGVTNDGRPYFAMEVLRGRDLRRELARLGKLAAPAALDLMAQALDGLSAAHRAGIVHRDIKLENLFVCDDGSLKILDFGIAKVLCRGTGASVAGDDRAAGTLRYMAPEQHAAGVVDARTDIYAAGLALYELVAGRGPFDDLRGNRHALRFAHCERLPPRPSELAKEPITPAVEEVILRAIAKSPADRFQTAAEMADALRNARAALRCDDDSDKNSGKNSDNNSGKNSDNNSDIAESPRRHLRALRALRVPQKLSAAALLALVTTAASLGSALSRVLPRA